MMKKWEYYKYFSKELPTALEINDFGEDGWELIQIIEGKTSNLVGFIAYFKRPLDLTLRSNFSETMREIEKEVKDSE